MNFNLPKKVLVLYENYTEERTVDGKGNILAGKPLCRESVEALFNDLMKSKQNSIINGFVPSNLFFMQKSLSQHRMIFRTEGRQQLMMFSGRLHSLKSDYYAIPNLIFDCSDIGLYVYAYEKWEEENTQLYYAPFPNITAHKVCTGVNIPKMTGCPKSYCKKIEDIFWDTSFTHFTYDKLIKGNAEQAYKKLRKAAAFDYSLLIDAKIKLKSLCN